MNGYIHFKEVPHKYKKNIYQPTKSIQSHTNTVCFKNILKPFVNQVKKTYFISRFTEPKLRTTINKMYNVDATLIAEQQDIAWEALSTIL